MRVDTAWCIVFLSLAPFQKGDSVSGAGLWEKDGSSYAPNTRQPAMVSSPQIFAMMCDV